MRECGRGRDERRRWGLGCNNPRRDGKTYLLEDVVEEGVVAVVVHRGLWVPRERVLWGRERGKKGRGGGEREEGEGEEER